MENSFFQFNNFIITRSLFDLNLESDVGDLSVGFKPSGKLDFDNGKFNLELGVIISDSTDVLKIEIESIGYFNFQGLDKEVLSKFLYMNAPAILFPYLRAYVSSLTTLSGIRPIVLPTLNLSNLREDLELNIEAVSL